MKRHSCHNEDVAEGRKRGRGSRWLAALLFLGAGVLLFWAIVLIVPGLDAEDGRTHASVLQVTSTVTGNAGPESQTLDKAIGGAASTPSSAAAPPTTTAPSTTTAPYAKPIADPARIVIPAIGVDSKVIRVGLLPDGSMETPPFGLAGWYELGAVPGAIGPAVIVAHVDTKKGPDVFFELHDLKAGDRVEVYGSDGEAAVFVVDSQEMVLKSELPTERIWNQTDQAVLRLITCGGEFDAASGHYLSNTIVYAHLEEQ